MHAITTRKDISELVHAFYAKIRLDDILGPIFNKYITQDQWPSHLDKLTDFWETNLFRIPKFKGNPTTKHQHVDAGEQHTISPLHFERWLQLWSETIDEHFTGELAEYAKLSAQRMAEAQFMMVLRNRPAERN